jgi:hypothetical protein
MADQYLYFKLKHHGFAITLRLNDIVIDADPDGLFKTRNFINNQFAIAGENILELEIGLAGTPPQIPKELALECAVYLATDAQIKAESFSQPLALLEFPGSQPPQFPAKITAVFTLADLFGRWAWQDGEIIDQITPDVLAEITSVITNVHDVLVKKDIRQIQTLMTMKAQEMARAYSIPLTDRIADQTAFFQELFADSSFAMEDLKLPDMQVIPMAHNRIFLCKGADDLDVIESKELSAGYNFSLPIYLSKINGKWEIVR